MKIILNNTSLIVNSAVYVEPEVLNNVHGKNMHTQYGYFIGKDTTRIPYMVQFPVTAGKTYQLRSWFYAWTEMVQAILLTNKKPNVELEEQFTNLSSLSPLAYYEAYGDAGTPEKNTYNTIEITPASNGYILCYVTNDAVYKRDFYLVEK